MPHFSLLLALLCQAASSTDQDPGPDWQQMYAGKPDPTASMDWFGYSLDALGDVDRDGICDLIVGSRYARLTGLNGDLWAGRADVYSGASRQSIFHVNGAAGNNELGCSVTGVPDLDGDGVPDFAIGTNFQTGAPPNEVYVHSGATFRRLYVILAANSEHEFSEELHGIEDVDGDGAGDLLISAPQDDPNGLEDAGSVSLYSGRTGGLLYTVQGAALHSRLGESLTPLEDVDGDGVPDFAAGGTLDQDIRGYAVLYSGATGQEIARVEGQRPWDWVGVDLCGTPDLTGDGVGDLLIGAEGLTRSDGVRAGAVMVYSGATFTPHVVHYGQRDSDGYGLGRAVGLIGDVDGDGVTDYCSDTYLSNTIFTWSGRTHERLRDTTPHGVNMTAVAPIGDTDGDGREEFALGLPGYRWYGSIYTGTFLVLQLAHHLTASSPFLSASGGAVDLSLDFPLSEAYHRYQLLAAYDMGFYAVGTTEVLLATDSLLRATVNRRYPALVQGETGVLDPAGDAAMTLLGGPGLIPYIGRTIYLVAVSHLVPVRDATLASFPLAITIGP